MKQSLDRSGGVFLEERCKVSDRQPRGVRELLDLFASGSDRVPEVDEEPLERRAARLRLNPERRKRAAHREDLILREPDDRSRARQPKTELDDLRLRGREVIPESDDRRTKLSEGVPRVADDVPETGERGRRLGRRQIRRDA